MIQDVEITNFSAGEFSPKLKGREDLEKYFAACDTLLNMVVLPQGGATRRPGTRYIADNKDQAHLNRPVRFVFNAIQAYILEFSDHNIRVYKDDGVVLNGAVPVDIAVPYAFGEIGELKFVQSADTLYIFHTDHPPAQLTRTSHIDWQFSNIRFRDGPYLDTNITDTTLTPTATSGAIALTASSTAGINGGQGFLSTDVGRMIRIKLYSLWAWCVITGVITPVTVTAYVQEKIAFGAAGAIDGAPWTANTAYDAGEVVLNHGNYYKCRQAGTSAPSGTGPNGTGTEIIDGSCVWTLVGGFNAEPWKFATAYSVDVVVNNDGGKSYQCIVAGESATSGAGPTGTGDAITDFQAVWRYLPHFGFPSATKDWRIGRWSDTTGYPADGGFWQERLMFAAPKSQPNHIDGSQPGDFTNLAPTLADGTVTDGNAISWTLDDDEVNAIHWLAQAGSAQSMQLAIGTDAGEHVLQAAGASQALTPTSVQAYRETSYGSARNVEPLRIGKALLFTDRPGRKLREFSYFWQVNGYVAPDLLQYSEHITRSPDKYNPESAGLKWMVYQQSPFQVVWAGRNDGALIGITYDREQTIFAPHRHQLGGNYYGGPPVIEWGDIIPSPDGTYDELWLSVKRTVNGAVKRFMEVLTPFFDGNDQDDAFFVDAGLSSVLTYPAATLTMTGLTPAHGTECLPETMPPAFGGMGSFGANADVFSAASVDAVVRVNGGKAVVTEYLNARHVVVQVLRPLIGIAPAVAGAWSCTERADLVTGLNHLEGEPVAVLGDGAVFDLQPVVSGTVQLVEGGASLVHAGLPNTPVLVTMPFEPKRAAVSASGRIKRVDTLWLRFHETLGCLFGRRLTDDMTEAVYDKVEPLQSRNAGDPMDSAPPLFSGALKLLPQGGHDREGQVIITHDEPLPLTVLSLFARGEVAEMDP